MDILNAVYELTKDDPSFLGFRMCQDPKNEKEYNEMDWVVGIDEYDSAIYGPRPNSAPTWSQASAKKQELLMVEPMRLLRKERDRLLAETDWWAVADRTMTSEQSAYRQALRDLPETATPILGGSSRIGITGVDWPVKPS